MDSPTIYCELINGSLHQPVNTISNVLYLILAVFSFIQLKKTNCKNKLILFLPVILFLIGIGSSYWHFSNSIIGDLLDTGSIIIFAIIIGWLLISELTRNNFLRALGLGGMLLIGLKLEMLPHLNGSLVYAYLLFMLGSSLFYITMRKGLSQKVVILILFFFSIGILARSTDLKTCQVIPFGTHFLWHIFVALMAFFLIKVTYKIVESE